MVFASGSSSISTDDTLPLMNTFGFSAQNPVTMWKWTIVVWEGRKGVGRESNIP